MKLIINRNAIILFLLVCSILTLISCAQLKEFAKNATEFFTGNKKVPIVYTQLPNDNRMQNAKVKKMAIHTFTGDKNTQFTAKITSKIAALKYKGSSCYTLVEPKSLYLLGQKNDWEYELLKMNSSQRSTLKKTADTVMLGTVKLPRTTQQHVKQERTDYQKCLKYNKKKQCIQHHKYFVSCTIKTSNVEFTAKAINVDSAKIVFTKAYIGTSKNEHCTDSATAAITTFDLENRAQQSAFNQLAADIAPHFTSDSPRIRTDDESKLKDDKKAYKFFTKARDYIGDKKFSKGCDSYQKASSLFNNSPSLNFNMGICKERQGDFKSAVSYYKKSGMLFEKQENEEDAEVEKRLSIAKNMAKKQQDLEFVCQ